MFCFFFFTWKEKGHFSLSHKLFLEFEFQVITYYVKLKEIWCKLSRKSCTCKKENQILIWKLSLLLVIHFSYAYCTLSVSTFLFCPVSLFLLSDTRVSNVPRPGCRTCRDPGVIHVKTRVSCNALPYLRIFFQPSVVSFPRACAYIIMCPFCLAFHPP